MQSVEIHFQFVIFTLVIVTMQQQCSKYTSSFLAHITITCFTFVYN